jgi:CRP/FNR family transcriptional regulator
MEDIVLRDAVGRLARYLVDSETGPEGLIELPTLKRHLASHLNLTSETFSRSIRRLSDAEVIRLVENNRVEVVDREKLHRIAEGFEPKI